MNQKITKLVRQALKECVSTPVESVIAGSIDGHGIVEIPNSFAEKFAELIVRECASYINERTLDWDADLRWIFNDGSGDMAVDVDELLNRHFGVTE